MSTHVKGMRRLLDPEAFDDFLSRFEEILPMREEVASKVRDLNPNGMESMGLECVFLNPWIINWIRKRGGLDLKTWDILKYHENVEWMHRFSVIFRMGKEAAEKKPSVEELVTTKWSSYLSVPPTFVVRADLAFSTNQLLYGKYATVLWCNIDYWRGEFTSIGGYHLEDGVPETFWQVGSTENIAQHMVEEDFRLMKLAAPAIAIPSETPGDVEAWPSNMNRRHLRLGIRLRDMPKKRPFDLHEWERPVRDICMDIREEMFTKWTHATLYMSLDPSILGTSTQQNFWGMSQWWHDPWYAMNATRILGYPLQFYTYFPLPPIINTLLALPKELWIRRLAELYFTGPKGLICDPVTKLYSPEKRAPLIHDIRRLMFEKGEMYKNFALPYDDGIPPPIALLTSIIAPLYKEANIRDFVANPDNLPKKYWELLESEGGIDRETGRIPPYSEVPRLKWLFDPTIEWLKPQDFPPLDWAQGQVWPMDITCEKMEIMVEEGYDGSGTDILHYSALADKKMGREGKTIMLGTAPYKLPTP